MYNEELKEIYKYLESSYDGLTSKEVVKRIDKYGLNKLLENKGRSSVKVFLDQFKDLMIIILILVDIFVLIHGILFTGDFIDFIVITCVILLNVIMGFLQENKAEVTLKNLMQYNTTTLQVKRDKEIIIVDSEVLVPGDVILLDAGDLVPADARIIECNNLTIDESALTGESIPVKKKNGFLKGNLEIQERNNMIFSGTNIVTGSVCAIVCKTGMNTEIGKIAKSLNTPYRISTPLEKKITELSKKITFLIFIILIITFIYCLIKGINIIDTIILCISLAVAAIPEGLPTVITICLSNGTNALLKKKTIVRQMSSVETIGSLDIICSDKTGTITQNKMKVAEVEVFNKNMLFKTFALCNDGLINNEKYVGDPTETCLYEYLKLNDINPIELRKKYKRIDCIPFDSDRKLMTTLNEINNKYYIFTKGSNDNVIERCKYIYQNNKKIILTDKIKNELYTKIDEMQNRALRVMSFAYKEFDPSTKLEKEENNLILTGIVGIIDPPRKDVSEAIKKCKLAHIRPIMITGDSLDTASAIAIETGIIKSKEEAIEGKELDRYNDYELVEIINKYSVYARVNPTHKERIVHILQKENKVVAMTGDGVNDAPAIKDADVGIGMGITGTDVTKNVSDIILLDDSFSTIINAVEEGRRIYSNIQKNIVYSLSSNIAEIFIIMMGLFFNMTMILPIHILFIDLVTDSIPSIALSFEPIEKNLMTLKPKKGTLFTPFILASIIFSSLIEFIFVIISYFFVKNYDSSIISTTVLLSLVMQEIIYAISVRNLKSSIFKQGLFNNKAMNIGLVILIIIEIIFFITPIRQFINVVLLPSKIAIKIILLNILSIIAYEMTKPIILKLFKD